MAGFFRSIDDADVGRDQETGLWSLGIVVSVKV
jgi:hypothetical protein